ncbi:flagellar assembly protein FliH [Virgibacillus halotolerans]|uniref:flagellar assembly protein FliH n=1 Tax=Virgibacillus halotolerans TaxID=1071053 RepID=UPI00196157AE|nr:flagellar assembly protein FliH [Virgibacillus halotolerans]
MSNLNEQPMKEKKQIKIKAIDLSKKNTAPSDQNVGQKSEHELEEARNELETILSERDILIQETKEKVEQEKQQWESQKKQWIEAAKAEGFQAGFSQGKDEGLQEYQQLLHQANDLTTAALKDYHATVEKSSEEIINLAIHTAGKVLDKQLTVDPNTFLTIVKSAIKEIKDQPIISIYLHPSNYQVVLQQKEEIALLLENEAKLAIYTRENIAENSCLIEHPFGQIDASVDTQLQQIRNALHTIATENKQ